MGISGTSEGQERMDMDEVTVGDVFKDAGYRTAAFGKWNV
jgi:arylsulfatase A-like enzyme